MVHKILEYPVIILVGSQMGENIGAVARAMMNCNLHELRLVTPRDGWPNPKAWAMASGADAILNQAKIFDRFEDAVQDCHVLYATTSRNRELNKPVTTPRDEAPKWVEQAKAGKRQAFVFGAERQGLENDLLMKMDFIIEVPLNPKFKSLNLAQAVLLCAYEWYQALQGSGAENNVLALEEPATHKMFENMFEHLNLELDANGFFAIEEKRTRMAHNVRSMFQRAAFSKQEVQIFHGILAALSGRRKHEIPIKKEKVED